MPYLDLPKEDKHFKALQKVGATGILRGEGRNVGWANQTWFRAEDQLLAEEIFTEGFYNGTLGLSEGPVKVGQLMDVFNTVGFSVPSDRAAWWTSLGLENYNPNRVATRLEAAVLIDAVIDPFNMFKVDYNGNIRY